MEDLLGLYSSLADVAEPGDVYVARAIGGRSSYRIAKDSDGNPTVLIANSGTSDAGQPVALRYLSFRATLCVHGDRGQDVEIAGDAGGVEVYYIGSGASRTFLAGGVGNDRGAS